MEVKEIMNSMTLKEKIAQMIIVRVRSDYYASDSYYKKEIENWIINKKVGGLITFDGNGNVHSNDFMKGKIDDVRIYSRSLSSEEITALYLREKP